MPTNEELNQHLAFLKPTVEGLQELNRHDMSEEAKRSVAHQIERYNRRIALTEQTLRDNEALAADGYPDMPDEPVTAEVSAELYHEAEVVTLALDAFTIPAPPVHFNMAFEQPEDK